LISQRNEIPVFSNFYFIKTQKFRFFRMLTYQVLFILNFQFSSLRTFLCIKKTAFFNWIKLAFWGNSKLPKCAQMVVHKSKKIWRIPFEWNLSIKSSKINWDNLNEFYFSPKRLKLQKISKLSWLKSLLTWRVVDDFIFHSGNISGIFLDKMLVWNEQKIEFLYFFEINWLGRNKILLLKIQELFPVNMRD